jgi:hypothetical protein
MPETNQSIGHGFIGRPFTTRVLNKPLSTRVVFIRLPDLVYSLFVELL